MNDPYMISIVHLTNLSMFCKFLNTLGNFSFSLALAKLLYSEPSPDPSQHSKEHKLKDALETTNAARKFLNLPPHISSSSVTLLCTSFDSESQVLAKYHDAKDILSALGKFPNVCIYHGVNAWELVSTFPISSSSNQTCPPSFSSFNACHLDPQQHTSIETPSWVKGCRSEDNGSIQVAFDAIVWNHPHLGTEDFRLHRFLMAHFFHSVSQVLKKEDNHQHGGHVTVTLVQG